MMLVGRFLVLDGVINVVFKLVWMRLMLLVWG